MENNEITTNLSNLAKGMLYFSESESPFVISNWAKIQPSELIAKIATEQGADTHMLKVREAKDFFEHLVTKADPNDAVMVENARKLRTFYEYAEKHLSHLQVVRVEGAARIPIVITGYLPSGDCIAIQTQAVET